MTPLIATQLKSRGVSAGLIEKLKQASAGEAEAAAQEDCSMTSDRIGDAVTPPGCGEQAAQAGPPAAASPVPQATGIFVNSRELTPEEVQALQAMYGSAPLPGRYWYDRMNGSWGREGGPTEGFMMAGLSLGGPLREDASNGNTGVWFNGRQLHPIDVARLRMIGPVYPGRYWMDAQGNIGFEGGPAFGNLWVAVRALSGGGGGGGGRKEGILSTYDKTGASVLGR
jgi:hypothetical protein